MRRGTPAAGRSICLPWLVVQQPWMLGTEPAPVASDSGSAQERRPFLGAAPQGAALGWSPVIFSDKHC